MLLSLYCFDTYTFLSLGTDVYLNDVKMPHSSTYFDVNDNKAVIDALRTGNEKAFDTVYRHYYRSLCAFCSRYVSEQEEIEGVVQETMMWLWENRSTLLPELTLKTLLFTIVKNKAINRLAHFEVRRRVYRRIVEKYEAEFSDPDFYLQDELFRLYDEALQQLPQKYRECYEMNRNQNLTHKEIAGKLDISTQLVNYRISQALRLLRVALKEYLPVLFSLVY